MSNQTSNNLIARKPLLMYFVFSFSFFWLVLILAFLILFGLLRLEMSSVPGWVLVVIPILGSWMPSLAAAIVTGVCEGSRGIRRLFARFFQFRLPARWYLAALIPAGLTVAAVGIYRGLGGSASGGVNLSPGLWAMIFVQTLFTGAAGEEPGWRGFALPRLLQRHSPLKAGLLLGLLWGLWHLPLWFMEPYTGATMVFYILGFNIYAISLTLLMTWIHLRTSHSLVPMVLAHFAPNFSLSVIVGGLALGPELQILCLTAGLMLVTTGILWASGGLSLASISTSHHRDKAHQPPLVGI